MKRKQMTEKSLSVREAYDQFQRYNLTKGLSDGTISYYESYSRVFFTFLKDTDQPLTFITKDTIDDYTLYLGSTPQPRQNSEDRKEAKQCKGSSHQPGEIQEQQGNTNDADSSFLQMCRDPRQAIKSGALRKKLCKRFSTKSRMAQ